MATIDDKVVAISFESGRFESGVNKTIAALEKLKAALHFPGAGKGLDDINAAAKRVDLSHIGKGVDDIKGKLSALSVAALAIFAQIATKAVAAGAQVVKAFTIDPIKQGFAEYSTNLNAIQTILANTQAAGTNLKQVNAALKELNEYSDKTIYNFSQMAKNIGTFTAAGVALEPAVASIKGIANLAALSGSNAEQASTAMYQLSQAISAGSVKLQDWNSVVNAGMGGTVFQRALAQTAEAMGTLKKGAVELEGPMKNVKINGEAFRQSLSVPGKASWLTSDVLTKTLQQFTGDLKDAELAAMGFNDAQIKAIQQTAKTAMHAATEVKTISQVFDVAKETAGSGWAQTFQIIFGTFSEAKKTFTDLSNTINGFINANADARNKVLADWKALGGRTVLIDAIRVAFHNLGMVIAPIKEAFRDIFPPVTGKTLYDLTVRLHDFAEALRPSTQTVENLKRTFSGLFALWDIGYQIIGGLLRVFARLFGVFSEGAGGFLNFTGNIGDFLVKVDEALKKGDKLNNFFEKMGDILQVPVEMLRTLSSVLIGVFSGGLPGNLAKQLSGLGESMNPVQIFANNLAKTWNRMLTTFNDTLDALGPAFDAIISLIQGLGTAIGEAASNMNFEAILSVIRTGLFAGLVLMFKNFFGKGSLLEQISKGFGGGIIENIAGTFKALEGSMVALQQNIKAKTIKEIAIAVALLAAAVLAISLIDPAKLNTALAGVGIMMGELVAAMALLNKIGGAASFAKLPIMAAGLIALAAAIDLLVIAVYALSRLSWEELLKGLAGVGALLVGITVSAGPLAASSSGMVRAGIGITAIAVGLNILALAVRQLSGLSWGELVKGLVGVGAALVAIAAGMQVMPKGMVLQGAALIAIAAGLKILAGVVEQFSGMNWGAMGKGMVGIGGALVVIAGAMHLMPSNMVLTAAGLLLVSLALGKISAAIESMGGMSISQIAKGLGTLAASLAILAGALYLMSGSLAGAAGLALAAVGINLIAGALARLGGMSWGEIIKGLVALGAALVIIGGTAALLSAVSAPMLAFGAALVVIGAGLALAGAGIALIGVGLSAIAVAGPTAIGILVAALGQLQKALIENAKNLVLGLLEIANALAATAPKFVDAIVKILNSLVDAIIQMSPKIAELFNTLITLAIQILHQNQARIIQAGFDLIIALLQGIKNNIPALVTLIVDIITRILNTIAANLGRIVTAGLNLLTSFVKGIISGYAQVVTTALEIITKFLATIAANLGKVVTAGLSIVTSFLKAIAGRLGDFIKAGVDIIVAFIEGVGNAGPRIITAAVNAITKFIHAVSQAAVKLVDEGFKAIINFLNGVANAIETHSGEMRAAGFRVGVAIVDGMTGGLISKAQGLYDSISGIMNKALGLMKKIPGISSPAKETMLIGQYIMDGLYKGISGNGKAAITAAEEMSRLVIGKFAEVFQTYSPSKVMEEIGQYVGQGFVKGLRGSQDDIRQSFTDLNKMLTEAMTTARETIASEQKKLRELREADKPDIAAIKEAQKVIAQNQDLLSLSTAGHIALTQTLKAEKAELLSLAADYERISEKLTKAQEALTEAKKVRDDAIKAYSTQYAALPDIVTEDAEGHAVDQLATYMEALKNQADAVAAYRSTLDQLRALGLDDATYQKLLEEGTADQEFATALLAGGKTAVQGLNTLDAQLKTEADKLAKNAARNLYQSGVNSAQRLVDGLASKKKAIERQMDETADDVINGLANGLRSKAGAVYGAIADIANEMVATLKKHLKIKSPSEIFADLGELSMEGFAQGFSSGTKAVTDAIDVATGAAIDTMKKSISSISDAVAGQLDTNPVITPILDLTAIRGQAQELKALTNVTPITAAASYGQASLISAAQLAAQTDETTAIGRGATSVKFEQNNYSPEALTEIEIYRQTKNQLSQLKTALDLA